MNYSLKRKDIREKLVNKCLSDLRKTKLPDYTLGFLIKSLHFHTPWYFLLLFILLPKPFALLATIPLIIAFLTFIYLQGCFLTIVEKKLLKDDDKINIIDPFIQIIGDETNKKNRYWYTLAISALYCVLVLLLLYCRGCFKWDAFHKFKIDLLLEPE
jgi:hypothetical protein